MHPEFKRFEAAAEFNADDLDKDGTFTGYGSVFDVVDYDMDIVAAGAFAKTLKEWGRKKMLPPVVWQHDVRNPVGPHLEMSEDAKGLKTKGMLLVDDVQKAREARALMKHKAVNGLSIGFITRKSKNGKDKDDRPVRVIQEVELLEVSIVTMAANPAARVLDVKGQQITAETIERLSTPREFEEILREVGFSKTAAMAFMAKCRKQGEPVNAEVAFNRLLAEMTRK
jgi:uncharacterized protein